MPVDGFTGIIAVNATEYKMRPLNEVIDPGYQWQHLWRGCMGQALTWVAYRLIIYGTECGLIMDCENRFFKGSCHVEGKTGILVDRYTYSICVRMKYVVIETARTCKP